MTHRINLPIQVTCQGQRPVAFRWQQREHQIIRVIEHWREAGEWWEKAPGLAVYRVLTDTQGLYELHRMSPGQWLLYKIYD